MKRIVVGVDESDRATQVLDAAIRYATAFDGNLIAVRAIGVYTALPAEALTCSPEEVEKLALERAERELTQLTATKARIESHVVREGSSWRVLCDVASEQKADLIVIGVHAYSGIARALGTTASRVAHHAPCSVLLVHL